jgi:hypothetical protein
MDGKFIGAAVQLSASLDKLLASESPDSDELLKLTAAAVNVLLYEAIERMVNDRKETSKEKR